MEPISAVGITAAAGLYAVVQITHSLYKDISRLDAPPEDIRNLLDEVWRFQVALQELEIIQFNRPIPGDSEERRERAILPARIKLETLSVFVQRTLRAAETDRGGDSWQWIRKKSNIDMLRGHLQAIRLAITISCSDDAKSPDVQRLLAGESNHELLLSMLNERSLYHRDQKQKPKGLRKVRPCYILIFLGFLTVTGSLVPALWRSIAHHDISDGFSIAQYILGVGGFIIACILAIHSRTCTCWSHSPDMVGESSAKQDRSMELQRIGNAWIRASERLELSA